MYHFVVRSKLLRAFRDINAGAYERILPQFAQRHRHTMYGRHALAGSLIAIPRFERRGHRRDPGRRSEQSEKS